MSGASETCPMEGMTGTMSGLGCVPRSSRGELYGHALSFFSDLGTQGNGSRPAHHSHTHMPVTSELASVASVVTVLASRGRHGGRPAQSRGPGESAAKPLPCQPSPFSSHDEFYRMGSVMKNKLPGDASAGVCASMESELL